MKKLLKKSEEDFKAKSTEEKLGKDWENMLVARRARRGGWSELIRLSTEVFGTTPTKERREHCVRTLLDELLLTYISML